MVLAASRKNRVRFFKVATLQRQAYLQPCNVPFREVMKFGWGCKGVLFKGCGCPVDTSEPFGSEAPTEPTGETCPCWGVVRRQRGNAPQPPRRAHDIFATVRLKVS